MGSWKVEKLTGTFEQALIETYLRTLEFRRRKLGLGLRSESTPRPLTTVEHVSRLRDRLDDLLRAVAGPEQIYFLQSMGSPKYGSLIYDFRNSLVIEELNEGSASHRDDEIMVSLEDFAKMTLNKLDQQDRLSWYYRLSTAFIDKDELDFFIEKLSSVPESPSMATKRPSSTRCSISHDEQRRGCSPFLPFCLQPDHELFGEMSQLEAFLRSRKYKNLVNSIY